MIEKISFKNYRNLDGREYEFQDNMNVIIGKNGDGKTNILDGIKLAFSSFDGNYVRIDKSDFRDSNDSSPIEITVKLRNNSIPSFNLPEISGGEVCGFKVVVSKISNGRYIKRYYNYDGTDINGRIVEEDAEIPKVYKMPLLRIEDIYSPGLTTGISNFIDSEEEYEKFRKQTKQGIKKQIETSSQVFRDLCEKFEKNLDIEVSDPRMADEKLYVVDGAKEHNLRIGSGYKSIANIVLCAMGNTYNIILVDEIENHLHPALLRNLINVMKKDLKKTFVIATTHSPVTLNEFKIEKIIDAEKGNLSKLISDDDTRNKINTFLHPGRAELMLANNIVLVEGFTEELILRDYISKNNKNWTVVNVAGIMFLPYIKLAIALNKRVIVVSDNDKANSKPGNKITPTTRFNNLKETCKNSNIPIVEVENTLETDLYNSNIISSDDFERLLKKHPKHDNFMIAKSSRRKMEIAQKIIESGIDLSGWHVIKEIENEFKGN